MIETKELKIDDELWVEVNEWNYPSEPDFCICTNIRQGDSWYGNINNNYYLDKDKVIQLYKLCQAHLVKLDEYEMKKELDKIKNTL